MPESDASDLQGEASRPDSAVAKEQILNFVRAIAALISVSPLCAQYGGPAILARGPVAGYDVGNPDRFPALYFVDGDLRYRVERRSGRCQRGSRQRRQLRRLGQLRSQRLPFLETHPNRAGLFRRFFALCQDLLRRHQRAEFATEYQSSVCAGTSRGHSATAPSSTDPTTPLPRCHRRWNSTHPRRTCLPTTFSTTARSPSARRPISPFSGPRGFPS